MQAFEGMDRGYIQLIAERKTKNFFKFSEKFFEVFFKKFSVGFRRPSKNFLKKKNYLKNFSKFSICFLKKGSGLLTAPEPFFYSNSIPHKYEKVFPKNSQPYKTL